MSRSDTKTSETINPARETAPVLSVELGEMRFGDQPVLGSVSLTLDKGEVVVLTGPSGVGKTTLIRIIAGLEKRYSGRVNAPENISMVFQEPTLMPWRSVADNLRIPLGLDAVAISRALAEVGLEGREDAFPNQLSLGQQRRLSLARAFGADPDLLLLDEPFVSLDEELADEMMSLFEALQKSRSTAVLMVTHDMKEAERLGERVLRLSGAPATLGDTRN